MIQYIKNCIYNKPFHLRIILVDLLITMLTVNFIFEKNIYFRGCGRIEPHMHKTANFHIPVLTKQVNKFLTGSGKSAQYYVDGTCGFGGHSRELLSKNPNVNLLCIDRDPSVSSRNCTFYF